jgi:hypothetical protein
MSSYHRLTRVPPGAPGQSFASSAVRRRQTAALDYDPPGFDVYLRTIGGGTTAVVEEAAETTSAAPTG